MKLFFRRNFAALIGILILAVFSGCAQDESVSVKSYNNSIVQIQKDMFGKAQEASQVFENSKLDNQQIMAALQNIRLQIQQSHDRFKAVEVPAGAESLYEAMEKFFQVELSGIQTILAGVEQLKGKDGDEEAFKAFKAVFQQFSSQESQALKDFYSTQQMVADTYGQKLLQVDERLI